LGFRKRHLVVIFLLLARLGTGRGVVRVGFEYNVLSEVYEWHLKICEVGVVFRVLLKQAVKDAVVVRSQAYHKSKGNPKTTALNSKLNFSIQPRLIANTS